MGALTGANPFVKPQASPAPAPAGGTWAGLTIEWQWEIEGGLRQRWPGDVDLTVHPRWCGPEERPGAVLVYRHQGLPVLGRRDLVPVRVEFHQYPPYACYDLPWHDYPRVFADPGAESLHRQPDGSLCLYYPWDPPETRWRYENGLVQLFDVVADHLHKELWWRHTGGEHDGVWIGEDAEHGEPADYRPLALGGIRP